MIVFLYYIYFFNLSECDQSQSHFKYFYDIFFFSFFSKSIVPSREIWCGFSYKIQNPIQHNTIQYKHILKNHNLSLFNNSIDAGTNKFLNLFDLHCEIL